MIPDIYWTRLLSRLKMTTRKPVKAKSSAEALGLRLLQSVREMKARNFARATAVAVNEGVEARRSTNKRRAN